MPENIFEEAKIKIKATLREGGVLSKAYTGKLDLIYQKNGTEIEKQADITVPKGSIDKTYDVKKVEGTEANYNLKVIANYGKAKEKTRVLVDAVVWPKQVKIKTVMDSKPAPNVPYKLIHAKGSNVKGDTNAQGVGQEDLKKCAYSLELKAPYELVSNKNDAHKREHTLTVRLNRVAKFIRPDISEDCYVAATTAGKPAGVRQYVNVATTDAGCDANGRIIEFEVGHKDQPSGMNGDKIYIKVVYSKLTKRNAPRPELQGPALDIVESGDGKTFTGMVQLTADGGTAKFNLSLGHAGGETFTVTCGYTENDPSDDKIVFVTWRKLGYQLRYPAVMQARLTQRTRADNSTYYDIPDAIFNKAKERLLPVFVEYANVKSHEYPDPAPGSPCLVTEGFFRLNASTDVKYVLDGSLNWGGHATAFDAPADDREIHMTLCDAAYSSRAKRITPTLDLDAVETEVNIDTVASYIYFDKTPTAANTVNYTVTGRKWKAKMSAVAAPDQGTKPAIAVTTFNDDPAPRTFRVVESFAGAPPIDITTTTANVLSSSEKQKIKAYYDACYDDPQALKDNGMLLNFAVGGVDGPGRQAVVAAVNEIHTASPLVVKTHPGFDDAGNPREGDMAEVTFTHVNGRKKKFVLPTGGPDCPGDFVGPASATKCPIEITFAMDGTYSINGNAGGGSQLMVLKTDLPGPCSSTLLHELGHSMGMTVYPVAGPANGRMGLPPGLPIPTHVDNGGTYYKDSKDGPWVNGLRTLHAGPHCCHGMPAGKRADASFDSWSPGNSDVVCIMWGSGGTADNRQSYCPTCMEIIKARNLTDIRSSFIGRGGVNA